MGRMYVRSPSPGCTAPGGGSDDSLRHSASAALRTRSDRSYPSHTGHLSAWRVNQFSSVASDL